MLDRKLKILIIDDEIDLLDIIAEQIECLGKNLVCLKAHTVEEAKLQINQCDMILSDIVMPNREQLEAFLISAKQPILRMSGNILQSDSKVLPKPFNADELNNAITELLKKIQPHK